VAWVSAASRSKQNRASVISFVRTKPQIASFKPPILNTRLRETDAIEPCTAGKGADTIALSASTYTLSLCPSPVFSCSEDSGLIGDLDIRSRVTLVGADRPATKIEEAFDSETGERLIHVLPRADVAIETLTLLHGGGGFGEDGAGVRNDGTLTMANTEFATCLPVPPGVSTS
jgi:hypothetical protein